MNKVYRVKRIIGPPEFPNQRGLADAASLQYEYGLTMFTLEQIDHLWRDYSDSYAAGWLISDKESIERVFNVELEEDNTHEVSG